MGMQEIIYEKAGKRIFLSTRSKRFFSTLVIKNSVLVFVARPAALLHKKNNKTSKVRKSHEH